MCFCPCRCRASHHPEDGDPWPHAPADPGDAGEPGRVWGQQRLQRQRHHHYHHHRRRRSPRHPDHQAGGQVHVRVSLRGGGGGRGGRLLGRGERVGGRQWQRAGRWGSGERAKESRENAVKETGSGTPPSFRLRRFFSYKPDILTGRDWIQNKRQRNEEEALCSNGFMRAP